MSGVSELAKTGPIPVMTGLIPVVTGISPVGLLPCGVCVQVVCRAARLFALVGAPHHFVAKCVEKVVVEYFGHNDAVGRFFYAQGRGVRQTLAAAVYSEEVVVAAAAYAEL